MDRLIGMAVTVILLIGCAHQAPTTEKPATVEQTANAPVLAPQGPQLIQEEGQTYRIVDTPFGKATYRVGGSQAERQQPEESPAPPEESRATTAITRTAPLPEKARETDKTLFKADAPSRKADEGGITLNFDEADLYEVIRTMADLLKINYMVDSAVRGQVTIHTTGTLRKQDLFPLFFQILETSGLTAVKEGPLYKIVPVKDAPRMGISARIGRSEIPLPPSERIVMQIIPLKNIDPEQMIKILTPFISADGTILSHPESKTLVLVDKGANILKALKLVEAFDIDLFSGVSHQFYKIEFNSAEDIVKPLNEVLKAYFEGEKTVRVISIEYLNMILVLSKDPRVFDRVAQIIATLDTPNETVQPALYVYAVKNGRAEDLSGLLSEIFNKQGSQKTDTPAAQGGSQKGEVKSSAMTGNPFAKQPSSNTAETRSPARAVDTGLGSATLRGEIKITPDAIRNALIIEAIPSDYRVVEQILERLDVLPRQVLIEAMIAEITLNDASDFGVEWEYSKGEGGSLSTSLLSATMGAAGMNYVIGQTDRWSATLSAMASEDRVNILSAPTVLASNDKSARINISTEVPVASSEYTYTSGSEPVLTTNIEYRNTGIILDVTPHINENGLVSMDISQEVSEQAGNVVVGGTTYPSFFNRNVNTTLTVGHNQTIAIGGLMRENKSKGMAGVPGISKIPIIGHLFGTQSQSSSKSELIILITPRVIVNLNDVDAVTSNFKAKVPRAFFKSANSGVNGQP